MTSAEPSLWPSCLFFFFFEVLKKHKLALIALRDLSGAAVGQKRHAKQPAEGDWIML